MYQIKCDGYILHDTTIDDLKVINPKCSLEINKTGALTFKVPPTHPYYDKIKKHISEITLYQDGRVLFNGRVLNDESDFDNIKVVECEGDLSYFIDSIQRPKIYNLNGDNAIEDYLTDIISIHNSQVDERKRFVAGNVTVKALTLNNVSNYENTQTIINKLLSTYGGMLKVRHDNSIKYLDYVSDFTDCNQTIEFGKNLVSLTKYLKGEDIYTAIIPVGANITSDTSTDSELEERVTISSLSNGLDGTIQKINDYIYDVEAVKKWGWIWKKLDLNNVDDPKELLRVSKETLKNAVNDTLSVELSAIDLHLLNVNIDSISVGDKIRCISLPHNLNTILIVQSMSIDVDNPASNTIKLVSPEKPFDIDVALTTKNNNTNDVVNKFKDAINNIPSYDNLNSLVTKNNDELMNYVDTNHPSYDNFNKAVDDFKTWADDRYLKDADLSDYAKTADLSNYVKTVDLSEYAKITDVNTAFNELANALEGV